MTREQAREAAAVMLAWADWNEVECKRKTNTSWTIPITNQEYNFDWNVFDYRIKPTKTLRPWTADEVPLGAWLRHSKQGRKAIIIDVTFDQQIGIHGSYFSPRFVLENCEHSLDGGKTWLPCGVEEESK